MGRIVVPAGYPHRQQAACQREGNRRHAGRAGYLTNQAGEIAPALRAVLDRPSSQMRKHIEDRLKAVASLAQSVALAIIGRED